MSFPRYERYKDSGVEWLGEVPEHWEVERLGALFSEVAEQGNDDLPILSVSIHDGVSDRELSEGDTDRKVTRSDDKSKYKRVQPHDLVYNMMRAWQGGFGCVEVEGMVSPAYVVARPKNKSIATKIVEQILRTPKATEEMRRHSHGVTDFRLRLYWDNFKTLRIPIPPDEEQSEIAAFLDRETAKIDALVEEQRRLIELLKEKRQAVISHAVTKGLNPDAPMKDSGVEWLGEVPEHWEVVPLGYYANVQPGFAFPSSRFTTSEEDTKLLRGVNVGVGCIRWDDVAYWNREEQDGLDSYELHDGDIVIGMDRPLISEGMRVAKIAKEDLPCLLLQRVAAVHCMVNLIPDFAVALLASNMFVAHFEPETTGVSVPHISPAQIHGYLIPLPPVEEQQQITSWMNTTQLRIDDLVRQAEQASVLLQERRTALISAAVTGKIDVRNHAPMSEGVPA